MENIYLVEKPKKYFLITNTDGEVVEDSLRVKALAKKIFENPEILETYLLGHLRFSPINLDDENREEIIAEIDRLVTQDKNALVLEYQQDN